MECRQFEWISGIVELPWGEIETRNSLVFRRTKRQGKTTNGLRTQITEGSLRSYPINSEMTFARSWATRTGRPSLVWSS